jgi:hypothetical protein
LISSIKRSECLKTNCLRKFNLDDDSFKTFDRLNEKETFSSDSSKLIFISGSDNRIDEPTKDLCHAFYFYDYLP